MSDHQLEQAYTSLVIKIFSERPRGVDERFSLETIRKLNQRPEKEEEILERTLDKINDLVNDEMVREESKKNSILNHHGHLKAPTVQICWSLTGKGFEMLQEEAVDNYGTNSTSSSKVKREGNMVS